MTANKPTGFTLARHEVLGRELQAILDNLTVITGEILIEYPGSRLFDLAFLAEIGVDTLRGALRDTVGVEHPGNSEANNLYFRRNRPDYVTPEFARQFATAPSSATKGATAKRPKLKPVTPGDNHKGGDR